MRNPEVPQCQIDKNSFPNSTFRSEDEFIKGLQFSYPIPLDFFNLKLFLLNQTPGSERVNFIAKIVQNHPSEIKEVFKDLVKNGLKIKPYIPRKSEVLRDSVIKLIDDFINEDSNFPVHEDSHESKNIFIAINARKINLVKAILERDPDSINATNSQNKSPIHIVVSINNKNLLQELLKYPSLDLYAKCNATNHDKSASSQLNVFDIAKTKNNLEIIQILENEHQMRLMAQNPNAIEFQKHRFSKEIASSSINPETSQQSSQLSQETVMVWEEARHKNYCFYQLSNHEEIEKMIIAQTTGGGSSSDLAPFNPPINEAVDSDSIGSEIATASDKSTNARLQMASPLINPDAPQASFKLSAESPMVWDDPGHLQHYANLQLSVPETVNMSMARSGSESVISVFRPPFIPVVHETTSLHQNQNHKARDPQSISSSIGPDTSSQSAFRPFKRTKTSSVVASISSLEAGQSIDYGEQITSRISPTSQESLSGSHKGQGGSK